MKTSTEEPWNTDSKRVMKENKAMAQEMYPKTSKKSYHHIKFWKSIMNRRRSIKKKLFSKISQYSQENNSIGVSFLIKMQTFKPATFLKRNSNIGVF